MFKERSTDALSQVNLLLPTAKSFAERFDAIIRQKRDKQQDVTTMNFLNGLLGQPGLNQVILRFRATCPDGHNLYQIEDWCKDVSQSKIDRQEILELIMSAIYELLNEMTAKYPHLMTESQQIDVCSKIRFRPRTGIRLQLKDVVQKDMDIFDDNIKEMVTTAFRLHLIREYNISTETFGFEKPSYTVLKYSLSRSIGGLIDFFEKNSGADFGDKAASYYSITDVVDSLLNVIINLTQRDKSDLMATTIHDLSQLFPQYSSDLDELDLSTSLKVEYRTTFEGFLESIRKLIEYDLLVKQPGICKKWQL